MAGSASSSVIDQRSRPAASSLWQLYCGSRLLLRVVPDDRWANMWRVQWPDGRLSDMVNLSRAKDAAVAYAQRAGHHDARRYKWRMDQSPTKAPPMRQKLPAIVHSAPIGRTHQRAFRGRAEVGPGYEFIYGNYTCSPPTQRSIVARRAEATNSV